MYTNNRYNSTHTIIENLVHYNLLGWANQFYKSKKIEGVSGFTLSFYKQQLGHFMRFCELQLITNIEEITPNVIRQFLLRHQETGHNPSGLHATFRTIRVFLIWYENEAGIDEWKNPV
jgi:site-specific recombinase XerC